VKVSGSHLSDATSVQIGGIEVERVLTNSDSTITLVTPELPAGAHRVSITTRGGTVVSGGLLQVRTPNAEMLRLVNIERSRKRHCGGSTMKAVKPLKLSAALTTLAEQHSSDMAAQSYFSHNDLHGSSPFDRMRKAGYRYSWAGENIAMGYPTVKETAAAFMRSPGHCRIIMSSKFTRVGFGVTFAPSTQIAYWTQDFARPR